MLKIHKLTQAQYDSAKEAGGLDEAAFYLTPAEEHYSIDEIDSKFEVVNGILDNTAEKEHPHAISDVTELQEKLDKIAEDFEGKADSVHSHVIADITNLGEATRDTAGLLSANDKIQLTYGGIPIAEATGDGASYSATVNGVNTLAVGTKITIIPTVVSTTKTPTLNVNGLGYRNICMPVVGAGNLTTHVGLTVDWLKAGIPVTLQLNQERYWIAINMPYISGGCIRGEVPITAGGTGAFNVAMARSNLSVYSKSEVDSAVNAKQNTITGAATSITSSDLTADRVMISDTSGKVAVSDITSTELGYLDGVTGSIQTQLDDRYTKAETDSAISVAITEAIGSAIGGSY